MSEQSAQRAAVSMGRARVETADAITLRISHKLDGAAAVTATYLVVGAYVNLPPREALKRAVG